MFELDLWVILIITNFYELSRIWQLKTKVIPKVSFVYFTIKLLYIFWIKEYNSLQSKYLLMELA